jgi:hypothetical protein
VNQPNTLADRQEKIARQYASPTKLLRWLLERRHLSDTALSLAGDALPSSAIESRLRLQKVENYVEHDPEQIREFSTNFVASLGAGSNSTIVYWLKSDGKKLQAHYGVLDESQSTLRAGADEGLIRTLKASFAGVNTETVDITQRQKLLADVEAKAAATITGIPGLRGDADVRLDEALEGLFQIPFDILLFARPVSVLEIDELETTLSQLINDLHAIGQQNLSRSAGKNFSQSLTQSFQETASKSESKTRSQSTSHTESTSTQHANRVDQAATALGGLLGAGAGLLFDATSGGTSASLGTHLGTQIGTQLGSWVTSEKGHTEGESETKQRGSSKTVGKTRSSSKGTSEGKTFGKNVSQQLSIERIDREAMSIRELLEVHLERLHRGRALGMWRTSVHVLTDDQTDLRAVTDVLSGALRGEHTQLEPLRVVEYVGKSAEKACESLKKGCDPALALPSHPIIPKGEQLGTLLSSDEVGLWIRPPIRDLPGLPVRQPIRFSSHLPEPPTDGHSIKMGSLQIWNRAVQAAPVCLNTRELCSHAFITGTTGAGKTTTVKKLLWGLQNLDEPVPFMLLEPAKSEYEAFFNALETQGRQPLRLTVDGTSDQLRINPFRPPAGLPLGRHVDSVKILLRSCFHMQESLPQILERVVLDAYRYHGWTNFAEIVKEDDPREFPSFADLLQRTERTQIVPTPENGFTSCKELRVDPVKKAITELGYHTRVSSNLRAATKVRLESFTMGLKGAIFCTDEETDFRATLDRPVFLSLSDIKDPDVRRFLLGSIFLRIYGLREAEARSNPSAVMGGDLRHLLVLEEAHHFVRAASGDSGPGAELAGQSNRLVADALAELRAYGQGILIADQSPADLDRSVIRNTNTKLLHRLLYENDCQVVGDSIGLEAEQRVMLRRLAPGECLVMTPSMLRPIACKIEPLK